MDLTQLTETATALFHKIAPGSVPTFEVYEGECTLLDAFHDLEDRELCFFFRLEGGVPTVNVQIRIDGDSFFSVNLKGYRPEVDDEYIVPLTRMWLVQPPPTPSQNPFETGEKKVGR